MRRRVDEVWAFDFLILFFPPSLLKSYPWASCLSDPGSEFSVKSFWTEHTLPYHDAMTPLPLDRFIEYGEAFQARYVPAVEAASAPSLPMAKQSRRAVWWSRSVYIPSSACRGRPSDCLPGSVRIAANTARWHSWTSSGPPLNFRSSSISCRRMCGSASLTPKRSDRWAARSSRSKWSDRCRCGSDAPSAMSRRAETRCFSTCGLPVADGRRCRATTSSSLPDTRSTSAGSTS